MEERSQNKQNLIKLIHPLFNPIKADAFLNVGEKSFEEGIAEHPHLYELAFYNGLKVHYPWQSNGQEVKHIFSLWKNSLEAIIRDYFSERDKENSKKPMLCSIGLLLCCMYWINGNPVPMGDAILENIDDLNWNPVNSKERLQFIFEKPNHYLAFIQLSELFGEVEKLYYRSQIERRHGRN
jgi:hypothetical protein